MSDTINPAMARAAYQRFLQAQAGGAAPGVPSPYSPLPPAVQSLLPTEGSYEPQAPMTPAQAAPQAPDPGPWEFNPQTQKWGPPGSLPAPQAPQPAAPGPDFTAPPGAQAPKDTPPTPLPPLTEQAVGTGSRQGPASAQPTLAVRNNNPGNLRFVGQTGAEKGDGGFAKFATPEDGAAAMASQLLLYQNRDGLNTVAGIVNKWAPPNENDTGSYIKTVSQALGVGPSDPIDLKNPATLQKVMSAMNRVEAGAGNALPDESLSTGAQWALSGRQPTPAGASRPSDMAATTGVPGLDAPQAPAAPARPAAPAMQDLANFQPPSMFSQQNLLRLAAGFGKGRNLTESIGGGAEALANGMDQDFARARAMNQDALAQRRAGTDEELAQAHIQQAKLAPAETMAKMISEGIPPATAYSIVQNAGGGAFKMTPEQLQGMSGLAGKTTPGDLYYGPDGTPYREAQPKNGGAPVYTNLTTGARGTTLPQGALRAQDSNQKFLSKDDAARMATGRQEADQASTDLARINTLQSLIPKMTPGSDIVSTVKRNASTLLGMNVGETDPAAVQLGSALFKQLDTDRVKALGGQGLGRINLTEVNMVKAAGPNWQNNPQVLNILLNYQRDEAFKKQQLMQDWDNASPAETNQGFNKFRSNWLRTHVTPAMDASSITGQPSSGASSEQPPGNPGASAGAPPPPANRPPLSSFQR